MKPRIIWSGANWLCYLFTGARGCTGIGRTPMEAYDDWLIKALGVKK